MEHTEILLYPESGGSVRLQPIDRAIKMLTAVIFSLHLDVCALKYSRSLTCASALLPCSMKQKADWDKNII